MLQAFAVAWSVSPSSLCPTANTRAVAACANVSLDAIDTERTPLHTAHSSFIVRACASLMVQIGQWFTGADCAGTPELGQPQTGMSVLRT